MGTVIALLQWLQIQQEMDYFLPLTIALLFFSFFFLFWFNIPSPRLPPSPPKLPIMGNFHQLGELPHRSLRDLSNKYGPLMLLRLGSVPTLIVSSAKMAKEITETRDLVFANRPATTGAKALLYGCSNVGIEPYGEYWREVRKFAVMELLSSKRVQSYKFIRVEEVRLFREKIIRACSTNESINLTEMLLIFANNLISRVAFGKTYDNEDGTSILGHLTRGVLTVMGAFRVGDYIPWLGWIERLGRLNGRMKKASKAMDAFFDQVIEDHLTGNRDHVHEDNEDLVDILLRAQKEKTLSITLVRDNIKAIILDMFVAGADSVAVVVEWAMVQLMRNPEMMKKAQEEVRRVVGDKPMVEEDVHNMEYLKCIVKESLRLHPPVPLLVPRESSKACMVDGYYVPAKARVFVNAWAIMRDSKSWKNGEEFMPERFMDNPIDFEGSDFHYLPFGAGRRGCPGVSFGLIASQYVIANLLFWFDWDFPTGITKEDLDMTDAFGLTVYKKNPTHLVPRLHFSP